MLATLKRVLREELKRAALVVCLAFLGGGVGLAGALQLQRPYHLETVASLASSRHTHVEITGKVTLVKREADGDWHIRISDGPRFIVAEIIPTLQPFASDTGTILPFGPPPKVGECVRVRGIRRIDNEAGHGYNEIHPVEELVVVPCP